MRGGGSGWSHRCVGVPDHHQHPSSPGTQICLGVPPLGVVAYGFWGPVLQSPASGRPTIVGGLHIPLPCGRIPPSLRGYNFRPSLPIIPISPLLCALVCVVTAWGAPRPLPCPPYPPPLSPPELSVRFVYIQSFLLLSSPLSLPHSKSQRFIPRTTNCPPPIKKSALSVASHAPFEKTDKANFLIGGGQLVVRGMKR